MFNQLLSRLLVKLRQGSSKIFSKYSKQILILTVICITAFQDTAYASLSLELTQGLSSAIPIGIVPFGGQALVPQDEAAIITNDLQNSGRFKPLQSSSITRFPTDPSMIDYDYWRNKGVTQLVVGNIQPKENNNYQVNFALVNIFGNKDNKANNPILLQQSFTVPGSQLRQLAHHISDLIYEKLTGIPGIFSTKIAYVLVQRSPNQPTRYILDVADEDGYNPQALLRSYQPIMSPTWSPDAKQIAYVSFENNRAQIYEQTVSTGQRHIVSAYPGINGAPKFSPKGNQLALVLTKTGSPNIFLINLLNNQLQQLTHANAIDTEPAFSPDGKHLLFTSNRAGGPQIYEVDLTTNQVQRITFNGPYNTSASFTPDGKSIIMLHEDSSGLFNIAVQDLQTGVVNNLTQSGQDDSPNIAPNGQMVIYATYYQGARVLGMVSIDGRIKLRLPAQEGGDVQSPSWSSYLG